MSRPSLSSAEEVWTLNHMSFVPMNTRATFGRSSKPRFAKFETASIEASLCPSLAGFCILPEFMLHM